MDAVEKRQYAILKAAHPDWPEDRLRRVARIWAKRARSTFWGEEQDGERSNPPPAPP